jgi:hypothetical protein
MLFGENLGRRHDGRLIPIRHRNDNGFKGDDGFAAATSPCIRRFIGYSDFKSSTISFRTRFCAVVG